MAGGGGHGPGSSQGCISSILRYVQFLGIPCTNMDVLLLKSQKLWNPRLLPLWQQLAGGDVWPPFRAWALCPHSPANPPLCLAWPAWPL